MARQWQGNGKARQGNGIVFYSPTLGKKFYYLCYNKIKKEIHEKAHI